MNTRELWEVYETDPVAHELVMMVTRKLMADQEAQRDALNLIARNGCENYTQASGVTCRTSRRTRGAPYSAESWCDACVATAALEDSESRVQQPGPPGYGWCGPHRHYTHADCAGPACVRSLGAVAQIEEDGA